MAHTHSGSYETHSRASSMSNWERLRGRASTAGGGGQGDMVREQHFNISLGSWWSNHSDTVGKLTPLFFLIVFLSLYPPSILIHVSITVKYGWWPVFVLFFSSWMPTSHSLMDMQRCTERSKVVDFVLFLLLHILKTYNPALKIRDNQQEQANTQIQHYIRVYLLWLSIDNS